MDIGSASHSPYLGRVVCTTGDDDLAGSSHRSSDTSVAAVLGAGLVEILTVKEFDTSGARRSGLVESDLGNVAVGSHVWSARQFDRFRD
jgi:hypothetical protein